MPRHGAALDQTERLLVHLSRVRPEPDVAPERLDGVERERLLLLAARLANFSLVARRLLAVPGALDGATRARVERNLHWSDVRERLLFADVREVAERLGRAGEPVVLLKGGAYTRFIYPRPGLRRFGDIDLLIRPQALAAAGAALGGLGYRARESIEGSVDMRRPLGPGGPGLCIELTTLLVHQLDYPYYRAGLGLSEARLLARAEPRDLDGVPLLVLTAADELVYSVVHYLYHHDLEGLKYQSDLNALLTDPRRPLAAGEAARVARAARAEHAVGLALRVQEAVFGPGTVPAELRRELEPGGLRWQATRCLLPPLERLALVEGRVANHPVKALLAPGLVGPLRLGLRWLFPGRRYLVTYYRLAERRWRWWWHLRYAAAIAAKALGRLRRDRAR